MAPPPASLGKAVMLEITELAAGYGTVKVLQNVSLSVEPGEIVALLGSNGAGKSTLNNVISGVITPFGGTVSFKGRDLSGFRPDEIVDLGIIQVPEGRRVFPDMTVRENLELGAYRRARQRRAENIVQVVSIFPRLKERFSQLAGTLSGGEQQMLAIGRALMSEPELLILDEPSLGLSPLLVEEMFDLITKLNEEGLAILLVEQTVVQSLDIAARAYVLKNGVVALHGKSADLMQNDQLRKSYLGI
jgi:branched-chain amino acid transport system ATP-binding protein